MHSRQPWVGERQVLAALWDDVGRVDDFSQGKKILGSSPRKPVINEQDISRYEAQY